MHAEAVCTRLLLSPLVVKGEKDSWELGYNPGRQRYKNAEGMGTLLRQQFFVILFSLLLSTKTSA